MEAELKRRWVEALRSGDYKQGDGYLKTNLGGPKFCCLGVLCDIVDTNGWVNGNAEFPVRWNGFANDTVPSDDDGLFMTIPGELVHHLAEFNDLGVAFDDIATYIEDNIESDE